MTAPRLTRSPAYVLTLAAGVLVTLAGWVGATLFDRAIVALTADMQDVAEYLPAWMESAPGAVTSGGVVAAIAMVNIWLAGQRTFRRLVLADVALVAGLATSAAGGLVLRAALPPSTDRLFDDLPDTVARSGPTSPSMAGLVAVLVLIRQWLPVRMRSSVHGGAAALLVTHLVVTGAPPYLGIVLDVGLGMVAASAVALALRTPDLQPGREAILLGLEATGLQVAELHSADVDARGSEPWIGTSAQGRPVFVKALSTDQRAADLLFRAMRWLRLRRTGDGPPEVSLRRAVEHEALVAHHARSLGVVTPRVLGVANVGPNKVAIAYEGVAGRSLDRLQPAEVTDEVLRAAWEQIRLLRSHRIAHRDLRLANVFLGDDGRVLLIDFGFAELAAGQQLLDTDVAELLAATATVVGAERASQVALETVGADALERARDWLHPLAFSSATRRAIRVDGALDALRAEVDRLTGHSVTEYEPIGRLSPSHVLGLALSGVAAYSLLAVVVHDELADHLMDIDAVLLATAIALGTTVPVLAALSYRAATGRRASLRRLVPAAFAAGAPVAAPTTWSFANRILSDAARDDGLSPIPAKQAASERCTATLVAAPLLVAGLAAAGLRKPGHPVSAIALGLCAGLIVASIELAALAATSSRRELLRVWIRPFRTDESAPGIRAGTAGWAAVTGLAQGAAFALAARSAGVQTRPELLVALGIGAMTVASLLPTPAGVGAVELLTGAGLFVSNGLGLAVLAAVLGRLALFWWPLPVALWAYRSTRHHRQRRMRVDDRGAAPMLDPITSPTSDTAALPSWWR